MGNYVGIKDKRGSRRRNTDKEVEIRKRVV